MLEGWRRVGESFVKRTSPCQSILETHVKGRVRQTCKSHSLFTRNVLGAAVIIAYSVFDLQIPRVSISISDSVKSAARSQVPPPKRQAPETNVHAY